MTESDEELLGEYLIQWEDLLATGQDTPASELCTDHPHLCDELSKRIDALRRTAWIDDPLPENAVDSAEGQSPSQPRILNERYRLDNLIAEGGFAQVWRGYDLQLHRIIAVKFPKPNRVHSQDAFMAEARRVARLKHHGIVPVYDVGRDGEACFIVSEFMEGGSLGDHLVKSPPSQKQAIRWIIEIAEALEFAHLHGVIHRDIKPANILINNHNRALLADFGIAHSANKTGAFAPSIGTLRYMPPEQLEGSEVDPRSDVFSLGIVLHESLTGKLPYTSDQPNVLRKEIASGLRSETAIQLPPEVRRICQKAIQHDPQHRYSSAGHFASDLRRAISNTIPKQWILAAIVLVIGFAFLAGWLIHSYSLPSLNSLQPPSTQVNVSAPTEQELRLLIEESRTRGSLCMQRHSYAEAAECYSRLIKLDPSSADAWHRRGVAYFNSQQYSASLADFSKAIELDSSNPESYQHRAISYTALRQFDDAIADIEKAISLSPADEVPYLQMATTFYCNRAGQRLRENQFTGAVNDANRAIELSPQDTQGYFQRATCHYLSKNYEKAVEDFTAVIDRTPSNARAYAYRGHCYRAIGKTREADADLAKATLLEMP